MLTKSTWTAIYLFRVSYGFITPIVLDMHINDSTGEVKFVKIKLKWYTLPWFLANLFTLVFLTIGDIYLLLQKLFLGDRINLDVLQIIMFIGTLTACALFFAEGRVLLETWDIFPFFSLMLSNKLSYRKFLIFQSKNLIFTTKY